MLKIIDKIIVSDKAPKGKNVLWIHSSDKGYQIKLNSGVGYININGCRDHEYVDLGLPSGTLQATCNVGATKPEESGNYYAWGETKVKKEYTQETQLFKDLISDISGNCQYDAARVNWGNAWRIPTYTEFRELTDNCTWEWTTQNGVKGIKITGNNNNFIFLPATGYCNGTTFSGAGSRGNYWSSSLDGYNNNFASNLYFGSNNFSIASLGRSYGMTIRPVKSK